MNLHGTFHFRPCRWMLLDMVVPKQLETLFSPEEHDSW